MRWTILFLSIFLISLAAAAPSLNFQHNETQPGETMIAEITTTGEFTKQIEPSDITFYEGRKQVPFESDIKFYKGTHYLYVYTTREGDFSIQIKDILYKEAEELEAITIKQNFTIAKKIIFNEETNQTSTKILSIKPGFIFTTQPPEIKFINNGNETLNITYNGTELLLTPQSVRIKSIDPKEVFSYFIVSTYKDFSIPVIYPPANSTFVLPPKDKDLDLKQEPALLLSNLFTNTETQKTIQLFNLGDDNITNIQTTSNHSFIEIEQLDDMPPRKVRNLTLTFNPETPGHFQGYINVVYTQSEKQNTLLIPISLFVLPEGATEEDFEISEQTCAEMGGAVCSNEENCEGEASFAKNGEYCCLGTCQAAASQEEPSSGSYGWLWAIIIFAALGGAGYYLYRRQKKVSPKKPEEQLKESTEKFAKRLEGTQETKRVTGGLTKS